VDYGKKTTDTPVNSQAIVRATTEPIGGLSCDIMFAKTANAPVNSQTINRATTKLIGSLCDRKDTTTFPNNKKQLSL
jgi:hypothetical protein